MDMIGVAGVEAEAELLGAITLFFERVGLTSKDVGIRVSSRKVCSLDFSSSKARACRSMSSGWRTGREGKGRVVTVTATCYADL